MILRLRILLVLMVILVSCNGRRGERKDEFIIRGQLTNAPSLMIILEELTTSELVVIDSIYTDGRGSFTFRKPLTDAGFFVLRVNHDVNHDMVLTLMVEPGEEIDISGDVENFIPSYQVSGSEGSLLLAGLSKKQWSNRQKADSIAKIFRQRKYEPDFQDVRKELEMAYKSVFYDQQEYVKDFIDNNQHSLTSIIALYQYFGNKLLLNESEHFEYFEKLSKSLSEKYPSNRHVMDLKRRVSEHKRNEVQRLMIEENLSPGAVAPEIVLPDPEGEQLALSSLRGKIVLIDFWAAWCPPCRKSNLELKKIYQTYHDSGFEIFAVSLDRTFDQWMLGIEEDQIDWIQVSDLRFWNSPVVSLYNLESIPYNVLIDREGKIIEKGLKPDEVASFLQSLL